jgi:hypothetical protein
VPPPCARLCEGASVSVLDTAATAPCSTCAASRLALGSAISAAITVLPAAAIAARTARSGSGPPTPCPRLRSRAVTRSTTAPGEPAQEFVAPVARDAAALRVALVGNPNTGRARSSTRSPGCARRWATSPGVTVERVEGSYRGADGGACRCSTCRASYCLSAGSPDEAIASRCCRPAARDVPLPDVIARGGRRAAPRAPTSSSPGRCSSSASREWSALNQVARRATPP